jgi:hypothetical protein
MFDTFHRQLLSQRVPTRSAGEGGDEHQREGSAVDWQKP